MKAGAKPRVLSERQATWLLNVFPPWLVQRIRVVEMAGGFRRCRVRVGRSFLTGNLNGTTFGGTIFSAADPVHAVMYWQIFAHRGVRVQAWLRSSSIRYVRPAATALTLEFVLTESDVEEAAAALASRGRHGRTHVVEAFDAEGNLCATAEADVYLRLPREDQKEVSAF